MIAYIIPTRDRPDQLARTLDALAALPRHDAQVVVIDNASSIPPHVPVQLRNGLPVDLVLNSVNEGAAARNRAARVADPRADWLLMLDDDSAPIDHAHIAALYEQPPDVLAVAAEIFLNPPAHAPSRSTRAPSAPDHPRPSPRESGGLPEVFVGCGVAIRRAAFFDAGGYDASFNYYAEEYDLAARLLLAGGRVVLDRRFRVNHRKVNAGRDMNIILRRLVRNNAWVMQRYAPDDVRRTEISQILRRYAAIAAAEHALPGYTAGAAEWFATARAQKRTPMSLALFDRFTGLAEARRSLQLAFDEHPFASACIIDPGKNEHVIVAALRELGVAVVEEAGQAEALVIGTLSPGPLLDSWETRVACLCRAGAVRLIPPWRPLTHPPPSPRELKHAA